MPRKPDDSPVPADPMAVFNLKTRTLAALCFDEDSGRTLGAPKHMQSVKCRWMKGYEMGGPVNLGIFPFALDLARWYEHIAKKEWFYTEVGPWVHRIENRNIVDDEGECHWFPSGDPRLEKVDERTPLYVIAQIYRGFGQIAQFTTFPRYRKYGIPLIEQIIAALPPRDY